MLKQNIKAGLIQGLTILFILSLGGISYAAFTTFTNLEATTNENLTAVKWNSLVDAVKDDYSTSETLTNKTWLGKPVYRKVINGNIGSTVNDLLDISTGITNGENARLVEFYLFLTTGNTYSHSNSHFVDGRDDRQLMAFSATDASDFTLFVPDGSSGYQNANYSIILEYTKTTDIAE